MVLEYMRLGRLDEYLRINKGELKPEDLIEAASNVAAALWHLVSNQTKYVQTICKDCSTLQSVTNGIGEIRFSYQLTN